MKADIDKLNQAIETVKKMLKKFGEQLAANANKGGGAPVVVNPDAPQKEDLEKLQQRVDQLEQILPEKLGKLKDDLDTKASLHDLANLQANLMDKLNELMANLENMFADKETTRKKLA